MNWLVVVDSKLLLHTVGHMELRASRLAIASLHRELVVHGVLHQALYSSDLGQGVRWLLDIIKAVHTYVFLIVLHPVAMCIFLQKSVIVVNIWLDFRTVIADLVCFFHLDGPLSYDTGLIVVSDNFVVALNRDTGVGLTSITPLIV